MSFLKPQNKTERIIFVSTIGLTLLILFGVLFSALLSTPSTKEQYLEIAQRQQEIIRIAEEGQDISRNREVSSIAVTTKSTISSSQLRTIQAIEQDGEKASKSELEARESSQTTSRLNTARQANRFDQVFIEILVQEISAYQQALERTYDRSNSQSARTMLQEMYENAAILLQSIDQLEQ